MKILFVAHEKDFNGASRSLIGMIDEFLKSDVDVHVLTSFKNGEFIEELNKRNIKIIYSKFYRWMIAKPNNKLKWFAKKNILRALNLINYISVIKICRYLKRNKIDIIHTNSSVINIGAVLSKYTMVPHVFHIREFGEEDFNMHPIFNKKRMLKSINNNSKKIICISRSILSKYKTCLDEDKIEVIYNGISDNYLNKKEIEINKKEYNVLLAGRIEEAKGQKDAINAMANLKRLGYDNVKLNIVGRGNSDELKILIRKLNVENNISIKEHCNNLYDIRKNIDFELVCSKNEAFGRVTIEGMMSSNPVIGSNTGGTKELIIDGFNGYLYEQGNAEDLAIKIIKLINNPESFKKIANNCYRYSSEKFTSKINAYNIVRLYQDILESAINES